jgi:murein DD-endopeptidase MepM/ murein hydrolase activator NlpD
MLIPRRQDVPDATGRGNPLKLADLTLTISRNRKYYLHSIVLVTIIVATLLAVWPGSRAIIQGNSAAQVPFSPSKQVSTNSYRDGYLRATVLINTDTGLGSADVVVASSSSVIPPVEEQGQTADTRAAAVAAVEAAPEPEPAYLTYIVQQGDTAASIAARHGLQLESLLWNNPELRTDPNFLYVGEELTIPSRDGILYTVQLGDTLLDIADVYQADVESIVGLSGNQLGDADSVLDGAVLLLPGAVPPPPPPPAVTPEPFFAAAAPDEGYGGDSAAAAGAVYSGFMWPVGGSLNDYFGAPRGGGTYHSGLDIGADSGTLIAAAAGGQVVLASSGYGYGNYVIVRHDNGYETLYAHLTEIYVAQGQWVAQGEAVGTVGSTGWATGPHLHFEVRVGGASVDPLSYLP